jgi:hypothetical protein
MLNLIKLEVGKAGLPPLPQRLYSSRLFSSDIFCNAIGEPFVLQIRKAFG